LEEKVMTLNLTDAQLQSVRNGQPLRFTQDETEFVLVRADQYEPVKALFDDSPLTADERLGLLQTFGKRAGWEDPELDVYEAYRKKQ
jgi:hypothetical protein